MMAASRARRRVHRTLESSAEKTARLLLQSWGSDVRVVVGGAPRYDMVRRVIYVPAVEDTPGELRARDAWRGMLDHEMAHVRYSPAAEWISAQERLAAEYGPALMARINGLTNFFEDMRIERLWVVDYPGSSAHLKTLHAYIWEKQGGVRQTDPEAVLEGMTRPLGLARAFEMAVYGIHQGYMIPSDLGPEVGALYAFCEDLVRQGEQAETFAEALAAATGIIRRWGSAYTPPGDASSVPVQEDAPPPELLAEACGGPLVKVPDDQAILIREADKEADVVYRTSPQALVLDTWETFSQAERDRARPTTEMLLRSLGGQERRLGRMLTAALRSQQRSRVVRGRDEGLEIDEEAEGDLAVGISRRDIWTDRGPRVHPRGTFVQLLVDCSGSMGSSRPDYHCERHGWRPCECPSRKAVVSTKAGHAAAAAALLQRALRRARVPHAVLGFTTRIRPHYEAGEEVYQRYTNFQRIFEFVPAPGIGDDGAALSYITGSGNNLDGEALMAAARYAFSRGRDAERTIIITVSDGLPNGADTGWGDPTDRRYLRRMVEILAHQKVEVYGIAVGQSDDTWEEFKTLYPPVAPSERRAATGAIRLDGDAGLGLSFMKELIRVLVKGAGL